MMSASFNIDRSGNRELDRLEPSLGTTTTTSTSTTTTSSTSKADREEPYSPSKPDLRTRPSTLLTMRLLNEISRYVFYVRDIYLRV